MINEATFVIFIPLLRSRLIQNHSVDPRILIIGHMDFEEIHTISYHLVTKIFVSNRKYTEIHDWICMTINIFLIVLRVKQFIETFGLGDIAYDIWPVLISFINFFILLLHLHSDGLRQTTLE